MSETFKPNIDRKEVSSLQLNQERWKVISGQELTPKTVNMLGGEEQVNLIKSGWEKQSSDNGANKTGEELMALGGAVNVIKMEKISEVSDKLGKFDKSVEKLANKSINIEDPVMPEVSERNLAVYKIIKGAKFDDLNENEQKLIGGESMIGLVKSGFEKQSTEKGAFKSGEELFAMTGTKGAAGIDQLTEDVDKLNNFQNVIEKNYIKREKLHKKGLKALKEKQLLLDGLTNEEKDILFPPTEVINNSDESEVLIDLPEEIKEITKIEPENVPEVLGDLPDEITKIEPENVPEVLDDLPDEAEEIDVDNNNIEKEDLIAIFERYTELKSNNNKSEEEIQEMKSLEMKIVLSPSEYILWLEEQVENKKTKEIVVEKKVEEEGGFKKFFDKVGGWFKKVGEGITEIVEGVRGKIDDVRMDNLLYQQRRIKKAWKWRQQGIPEIDNMTKEKYDTGMARITKSMMEINERKAALAKKAEEAKLDGNKKKNVILRLLGL